MCYYGKEFPRFIKKDQGHFNLMADLHTIVRNGQQNLYRSEEGKHNLIAHLQAIIENTKRGEYTSICTPSDIIVEASTIPSQ